MRVSKRILYYWLPVAAYMLIIGWLSAQSRLPLDEEISRHDKALHAVEYGGLSLLAARAFLHASPFLGRPLPAAAGGAALAILHSFFDEWHQSFVPGRTADPGDLAADAAGTLLAALLFPLCARRFGPALLALLTGKEPPC